MPTERNSHDHQEVETDPQKLAAMQSASHQAGNDYPLLEQLEIQSEFLRQAHRRFIQQAQSEGLPPSHAAEWILDNDYIINQAVRQIDEDLPLRFYEELPKLDTGSWHGYPRVYLIARSFIIKGTAHISTAALQEFVAAYQEARPLTTGELWALPIMLRIGILEELVQALATVLEEKAPAGVPLSGVADQLPADSLVGNCILSLRAIANENWKVFFEQVSLVEKTLERDPAGVYLNMDFETRDRYRKVVEELARATPHDELDIAQTAIYLAEAGNKESARLRHVGYYLIDEGRPALEKMLGHRPAVTIRLHRLLTQHRPAFAYLGSISILTLLIWLSLIGYAWGNGSPARLLALVGLLTLIPAITLATSIISGLVPLLVAPRLLPKLDFEEFIPAEFQTMVVMPCLITGTDEIKSLLEQLELHYLRNANDQITFALLTDFADATEKHRPEDEELLRRAKEGLQALNKRYPGRPFYLFHRERLWNSQEEAWMGWERKRGKLEEFNRLLRGAEDTTFTMRLGDQTKLSAVRYVITLDADTVLPRGAAQRLIGTLAHPLNQAQFDSQTGRVIAGYTILQPRTEIKPVSAHRSLFSRIFSGASGIDLYTHAVSDIYQDLFGEGIYVGKGIYDVDAFARSLEGRVPENALLSHDLFEGLYGRAGLVTDITLYEDYPADYLTYAYRQHRWIRGDWQLLPWLWPRVPQQERGRGTIPNVLSTIDIWKIADNLRRSLVAPALSLLLVAGWLGLPGSPFWWSVVVVLTPAGTLLSGLVARLAQQIRRGPDATHLDMMAGIRQQVENWLLFLVFLPFEALLALDAAITVIYRLFISHKKLLQWTAAAHTVSLFGRRNQDGLAWREMGGASLLSVVVGALVFWLNTPAFIVAVPFILVWSFAPQVALVLSRPISFRPEEMQPEQEQELRFLARSTWLFFEQFMGPVDNWLPPDHFQEHPRGLVAHRTSPTNIGLALLSALAACDLGYVGLWDLSLRLQNSFQTLQTLERYRGHFLNWYDTRTKSPLPPRYVSTVDSGNLAGCLLVLRQGCLAMPAISLPRWQRWQGLLDTLLVFNRVLENVAAGAPEQIAEIQKLTAQIRQDVLESRHDSGRWASLLVSLVNETWPDFEKRLVDLVETASLSPDNLQRLHTWSERTHHHLYDMQRWLNTLLPWLLVLETAPEYFLEKKGNPAIRQAWAELRAALPSQACLGDLLDVFRNARLKLANLQQLLAQAEGPAGSKDEAQQWCVDLADKLAGARQVAGELLDRYHTLGEQCLQIEKEMAFGFLYDPQRDVFRIGYNVDAEKPDPNYYDLLASEARTASLIAIARREVPQRHWLALGRPLTSIEGRHSLISWSGTMFEYLMPTLFTRHYTNSLLHESVYAAVQAQIAYSSEETLPWGISESGYYHFDAAMNYQYRAFGIPWLGFKRDLEDDLVIAPYASLLALPFFPQAVVENLTHLRAFDMWGDYGLYEAIDFTPSRLVLGQNSARVRSFMVHHQGMILLSLVNSLEKDVMVERFHADPLIQSIELLLQERIPEQSPLDYPGEAEMESISREIGDVTIKSWPIPQESSLPLVHYLANGRYGTLITNAGSGFSRWQDTDLTRWRADTTQDDWGTWIYVQDLGSGEVWSAGPQPLAGTNEKREISFAPHKVDFRCEGADIVTYTEIIVVPEDDVEIRRVQLTNRSVKPRRLRLASYGEVVLAPQDSDRRHPAFNKMFIESEYLPHLQTLLFTRRPRSGREQPPAMGHLLVAEPALNRTAQCETDRARFIGRGGTLQSPSGINPAGAGPSGTTGAVLDPIMCLVVEFELPPHSTISLAFLTLAGADRATVLQLAEKYQDWKLIERTFPQAYTQNELEMRRLEMNTEQIRHIQQLLSLLLYPHPALRSNSTVLVANTLGQPGLWSFAISGDYPILVARIQQEEELSLAFELLKAHTYWRNRGLKIDLVLINMQAGGYNQVLQGQMHRLLHRLESDDWLNRRGGIFLLQWDAMNQSEQTLLLTAARVVLDGQQGSLAAQLPDVSSKPPHLPPFIPAQDQSVRPELLSISRPENLLFDNGWGGFSPDGCEYIIYLSPGEQTPAPWVNIIANPRFGFLISESGAGYTWAANSSENRLTPWQNDPVCDRPGEALFLRDEETAEIWSPTPAPAGADTAHLIRHGAGYSILESQSHGLRQLLRFFAAPDEPVKIVQLRLENKWEHPRRLTATYYAEWVLGVNRDDMQPYIIPEYDHEHHALLAGNPYHTEFGECIAFLAANQEPHGLTTDRTEFLGRLGKVAQPAGLRRVGLSGNVQPGQDPCATLQLHINLQPGESKEIYFLLGQGANRNEALNLVQYFQQKHHVQKAWIAINEKWDNLLNAVTVNTPDEAMNILINRWLPYQNLSCRIWGRSALYQSGGAYGFRDQLQDVAAALHHDPAVAREHILRAAHHQFEAGDVLHWWHPPSRRGVRTRITDDLLWLPYVTAYYVQVTGDSTILYEKIPFLRGEPLQDDEEERYSHYPDTAEDGTLYEHCCRALDKGSTAGVHGLPLMGTGDWNDGMNRVGIEGKGESVWLGWFLYSVLRDFSPLCMEMADGDRADQYRFQMIALQEALQNHAWDGNWYLRAFYDDGTPLGSARNKECQIDAIAQSWAVLSGAGDGERTQRAMAAVDAKLVHEAERLVLLFTPPFDKTAKDPGYIKGYPPGIRENGGQYTHAAIWTAWAFATQGNGDRAGALFQLLNPIRHSDSRVKAQRYRVEPYVTAADIYSTEPFTGRGGWTWYTGSGGWLFRLGLEAILGLKRKGDILRIQPCIPQEWPGYTLIYRHGESVYHICVNNPDRAYQAVHEVKVDGHILQDGVIRLQDDGCRHEIQVRLK